MTTTTIWREIDGELLAAGLHECFDLMSIPIGTQDVSEDFVRALIAHLEESDLICDHSVNICACSARGVYEALTLWLAHKRLCVACGGDGVEFLGFDANDDEIFVHCPHCERGLQALPKVTE